MTDSNTIKEMKTINNLLGKYFRFGGKVELGDGNEEVAYSSLSPVDDIKGDGSYLRALKWAIDNRKEKDIKNVALTGPYGSGKSSVLKTFQKKYSGKELQFLNISLATFKDEKHILKDNGQEEGKGRGDKNELLRLIEISILQQIFYRERDRDIPDSRFKRIISIGKGKLFLITLGIVLFLLALIKLSFPTSFLKIFKDIPANGDWSDVLHYGSVILVVLGGAWMIFKSIRIISSYTINKLAFQNAEIGIEKEKNKSILNHHLDEILYFFRVRPYNVVVFEDLDRFEETEIFTKLREINLLLNSSQKTKGKGIVFIYAVRDDMFSDDERIKFFDFIIPIIPVINSYNSNEILLEKKQTHKYQISNTFIEDISYFIDDMRLLHNICNEFFLYRNKLDETLNEDKLFAIITYKNIYPNDFVNLCRNQGHLYEILSSKGEYITKEIGRIDYQISKLKEEIENIESNGVESVKELRMIYILRLIASLDGFTSFVLSDETVGIDRLLEDDGFSQLKSGTLRYNQYIEYYGLEKNENLRTTFSKIEKQVHPEKTYDQREKEILDKQFGRVNELKNEIKALEPKKLRVKGAKFSDLLQSNDQKIPETPELDYDFINVLLRNGYIQEDYLDYVSVFHEGSVTRADHKFVLSVKTRQPLGFDYPLSKIGNTIKKISPHDFESNYVFNYSLLEFMLQNEEKYPTQIDFFFNKLGDESDISLQFFAEFFEKSGELNPFFKYLCRHWKKIWRYIDEKSLFPAEDKQKVFEYILDFAEVSSIVDIASNSNLKQKILGDPEFLTIIQDLEKLKQIIKDLELVFTELDFNSSPRESLQYILENDQYELNAHMLRGMMREFGHPNPKTFDKANYSAIKESKCESLIEYVGSEINHYIETTFLELENNSGESEENILELLNNKEIELENRKAIITKTETKIEDVSQVVDHDLAKLLFEENKVEPTWENLIDDFRRSEHRVSPTAIDFINRFGNAEILGQGTMPIVVPYVNPDDEEEEEEVEYQERILLKNDIEIDAYTAILKSVKERYIDLKIEKLTKDKVNELIIQKVLDSTLENYKRLENHFSPLNISFFELHLDHFLKYHASKDLRFELNDLNLILRSDAITNPQKAAILNEYPVEDIYGDTEILKQVAQILLRDNVFEVSTGLYEQVLLCREISGKDRIDLFTTNQPGILFSIDGFIKSLGGDYAVISDRKKKAKIDNNPRNKQLLETLKQRGYISSYSPVKNLKNELLGVSKLRVNHKRS